MKIDDLQEMIDKDSNLDRTKLSEHSLGIPNLSNKYHRILYDMARVKKRIQNKIAILTRDLTDYYKGYASDEVYKNNPLNRKPSAGEIDSYIKSNENFQKLNTLLDDTVNKMFIVESFIKQINQRSFLIKNVIEWEKFQNGGY